MKLLFSHTLISLNHSFLYDNPKKSFNPTNHGSDNFILSFSVFFVPSLRNLWLIFNFPIVVINPQMSTIKKLSLSRLVGNIIFQNTTFHKVSISPRLLVFPTTYHLPLITYHLSPINSSTHQLIIYNLSTHRLNIHITKKVMYYCS